MINFQQNTKRQRKAYEKKEKFSAAIKKKIYSDEFFFLWEKGAFKFKVKKSFRCCMSKKGCFGTILPL